jgi:hypothetical protein
MALKENIKVVRQIQYDADGRVIKEVTTTEKLYTEAKEGQN